MSGNIEDFLRKAAQQRKQRRQQSRPTPQPPEPVEIVEPEVIAEPLVPQQQFPGTVASHVAEHLANDQFQDRASHLGEEVGLSDDRLAERLHDTFDHGVGQLSQQSVTDDAYEKIAQQSQMAADLARMLRSAGDLKNAIVLSEILQRPSHRW